MKEQSCGGVNKYVYTYIRTCGGVGGGCAYVHNCIDSGDHNKRRRGGDKRGGEGKRLEGGRGVEGAGGKEGKGTGGEH